MNSTTPSTFSILSSPYHDPSKFHADMMLVFYGILIWMLFFAIVRLYPYNGGSKTDGK